MAASTFPVVLSFDVDGEAGVLFRNPENASNPVELSQGRYGVTVGVPRILDFLLLNDIQATFFVPGWIADHYPDTVKQILDGGHEVGHHGYLHETLTGVSGDDEERILVRGLEALEKAAGIRPVGYRAPRLFLTDSSLRLLERYGFLYSSNMLDADVPYRHTTRKAGNGMVELPVDRTLGDAAPYLYSPQIPNAKMMSNAQVLDLWCGSADGLHEYGGYCMMTCHPEITGRPYRMLALRAWVQHVRQLPGAVFMTAKQLASTVT
jgi:Predicted xylanase/chitin deacetylase